MWWHIVVINETTKSRSNSYSSKSSVNRPTAALWKETVLSISKGQGSFHWHLFISIFYLIKIYTWRKSAHTVSPCRIIKYQTDVYSLFIIHETWLIFGELASVISFNEFIWSRSRVKEYSILYNTMNNICGLYIKNTTYSELNHIHSTLLFL